MKQVIIVISSLKLPKGKLCSQVCHAAISSLLISKQHNIFVWNDTGCAKIILKVSSLEDLLSVKKTAELNNIKTCIIQDTGKTTIKNGTITCMGIEILPDDEVNVVIKQLKLL